MVNEAKEFFKFLEAEGALLSYFNNLIESRVGVTEFYHKITGDSCFPDNYVDGAFLWESTPEGSSYWLGIDAKWLSLLKEKEELKAKEDLADKGERVIAAARAFVTQTQTAAEEFETKLKSIE